MNDKVNRVDKWFKILLIFLTFIMVGKLLWIAVINHEGFLALSRNQVSIERYAKLPRGTIYDCNGEVLAHDVEQNDLEYIESGIMSSEKKEELAKTMADIIILDDTSINDIDLRDFVLTKNDNLENITDSFTKEELAQIKEMSDVDYNNLIRSKLTQEQIDAVTSQYTPEQLKIIILMNQSNNKKAVTIKSKLSEQEYYDIAQIANKCGGFYLAKNYVREYPQGDTLRSFLGQYGPIPQDQLAIYESQGYSANANVGTSYLELELEQVLRSHDDLINMNFDQEGNITQSYVALQGTRGNDAYLTINLNIQRNVEDKLVKYLEGNNYEYCKNAYATIVDPDNGNLIALGGKAKTTDNQIVDYSIGNFTESYTLGSTIKPAILSLGYHENIVKHGDVITDQQWNLLGTPTKGSYKVMGDINEQEAIARSSNVYFYTILLRLAGYEYSPQMSFSVDKSKFDLVRNYLQQFGLGSPTGIGMEHETYGVTGDSDTPGLYLDLANGQYDTYTNLQQTQYAATVESLGTRYKINYLDHVQKPNRFTDQSKLIYQQTPQVLNHVDETQDDAQHVRDMMDGTRSFSGSTVASKGFKVKNRLSAKTGTSESFYYNDQTHEVVATNTTSFIGTYQGSKHKYSIGVVVPNYTNGGNQTRQESGHIAAQICNQMEQNND